MLLSAVPALAASVTADAPYTDNFSDKAVSEAEWQFSQQSTNTSSLAISASEGDASVSDGVLQMKANSGVNRSYYLKFDRAVSGNLKASFKIQVPTDQFFYIDACGQQGTSNNVPMNICSLWAQSGKLVARFYNPYVGTKGIELTNHTDDKWYNVTVMFYADTAEFGVTIGDSAEYRSPFSTSNGNFKQASDYAGLTRLGFTLPKGTAAVNIDDFKLEIDIPLEIAETNITDGAVNVDIGKTFDITFNKVMDKADDIKLYKVTGSGMSETAAKVEVDGKTVTLTPDNDLDSLTKYKLVIPTTVAAKDGKKLAKETTISFTTMLVDDISIENAALAENTFTAEIKNSSPAPIGATARLTVYKTVSQAKQLVTEFTDAVTVDGSGKYEYSKTLPQLPEGYTVSLSVLDDKLAPLCSEAALDKNGAVTELSDTVTADESSIDYDNGVVTVKKLIGTLAYAHRAIEIKNESGAVIYFDQLLTNENGSAGFSFVPAVGLTAESYTVTINGTEMTAPLTEALAVDYSRFAVSVTKPTLEGKLSGGETVSAKYDFASVIGEEEGDTAYVWLISDKEADGYAPITNAVKKTYTITDDDENKYIKVSVTPKTKLGLAVGTAQESDPIKIEPMPKAAGVSVSGTAKVGNLLTGVYSYSHKNNAAESGSVYEWLTADSENGTYTSVGNGLTYMVKEADAGKYIKFAVTPGCSATPSEGKRAESSAVYLVSAGNGGGGGNGGSGGKGSGSGGSSGISIVGSAGGTAADNTSSNNAAQDTPSGTAPDNSESTPSGTPSGTSESTSSFTDIGSSWARTEIEELAARNIVKGDENGSFKPESNVSRAEFTAMLIRLLDLPEMNYDGSFADVSAEDWYADTVQSAIYNGLASGDGDSFRPTDSITREEMAVILIRAYERRTGKTENASIAAADAEKISTWAAAAVGKAYTAGLVNGFEDGSFLPQRCVTRAEAAAVMLRLWNCIEEVGK